MIINIKEFMYIRDVLAMSDIHPADCAKITDLIIELSKQRNLYKHIIDVLDCYMRSCIKDTIKYGSCDDLKTIKEFYDYPLEILDKVNTKESE